MHHHTNAYLYLTLIIIGSIIAWVSWWYILGMGIGIARRGYERLAPNKVRPRQTEVPALRARSTKVWS
jgi:hypothetical protein